MGINLLLERFYSTLAAIFLPYITHRLRYSDKKIPGRLTDTCLRINQGRRFLRNLNICANVSIYPCKKNPGYFRVW
ncbi:hypothetical protein [Neomoorella thermoacetica]|uniref:hypothetical protein n=1 Tax=Neomoorella thermoacetica TaxID=1525 RepID=UPI0008FB0429|nr:hypothetical protein [Moorella thermoacetica]APC07637.1 hypothetical protein MTJW_04640 [Moorella thermoacetica]OIQ53659.1 hypothetical protein MORE_20140 [Moorella thermoacetica]